MCKYLFILFFVLTHQTFAQKMTGFWQGMLYQSSATAIEKSIPVYLDIFVANGNVDGQIRIENELGASVYPIIGKYENYQFELITLKATWHYLPEYSLSPNIYKLNYNPKSGYLEGTADKDNFRIILYQTKGEISRDNNVYIPKDWLKRFEQELKDGLSAPNIRKIELQKFQFEPIYFDYDQAIIKQQYETYLIELIRMVKSHSDLRIQVIGHTDADGSQAYNLDLSARRAKALVLFFEKHGLSRDRVVIDFKGESEPIDDNTHESGKQKNRRVDFRFI